MTTGKNYENLGSIVTQYFQQPRDLEKDSQSGLWPPLLTELEASVMPT